MPLRPAYFQATTSTPTRENVKSIKPQHRLSLNSAAILNTRSSLPDKKSTRAKQSTDPSEAIKALWDLLDDIASDDNGDQPGKEMEQVRHCWTLATF
jgi:hypothetical protein